MSGIPGTNIAAPIVPFDTADSYPTHDETFGRGGSRTVAALANLTDATIPLGRRKDGMMVFCRANGLSYRLAKDDGNPADAGTWLQLPFAFAQLANLAGTGDALTSDLPAGMVSYQVGQLFYFFPASANTGAATFNIGGLGAIPILAPTGVDLVAGDLAAGRVYFARMTANPAMTLRLVGSAFLPREVLTNAALSGTPTAPTATASDATTKIATTAFTQNAIALGKIAPLVQLANLAGTANSITADLPNGMTAYGGQFVYFFAAATNTGPVTISIGGLGAIPLQSSDGQALVAGDIVTGRIYILRFTPLPAARMVSAGFLPRDVLVSPALTGTPTAPTPPAADSSTRLATTASVQNAIGLGKIAPLVQLANLAGTANAITADLPNGMTAYTGGQFVYFFPVTTNTGAVTLNLGGLGAIPLQTAAGAALVAGDLAAGRLYVLRVTGLPSARIVACGTLPSEILSSAAFTTAVGALVPPEEFPDVAAQFSNTILNAENDIAQAWRVASWTGTTMIPAASTSASGRPCWSVTAPAAASSESGVTLGPFPAAAFSLSAIASFVAQIFSLDAYAGANSGQSTRILVTQRDAAGTEIAGTRLTFQLTADNSGIAAATWLRSATIARNAATDHWRIYIGIYNVGGSTARTLKFGDVLLAPGGYAIFRRQPTSSAASSGGAVIYVSTTGSDTNSGTLAGPLRTLDAAILKLGGSGSVYVARGTYGPEMRINPTNVTGRVTIIGQRGAGNAYDSYPTIYLTAPLTGITKTAGRAKVYQATIGAAIANANFQWAWQDGVADPRTLIPASERHPLHRGRSNRLMFGAKLVKTVATTLAAALTEIDAAGNNDPRAFIDDSTGVLYYSIVGGGDGSAASIYLDAASGLVSAAARESCGTVELRNLEPRYGGVNLTPFRHAHVDELIVNGAAVNCVDYSSLSYGSLECAGSGGWGGLNGDCLNGHNGAKLVLGGTFYGHDGWDDGWSDHEGCSSRMMGGGLTEYNGGTGFAAGIGSDHMSSSFIHRNNQLRAGWKQAQAYAAGIPGDGGVDTIAVFIGHVTYGGTVGYYDDGATGSGARAICINCKAYDYSAFGFDVSAPLSDCGANSASGAARSSRTSARNSVTVT